MYLLFEVTNRAYFLYTQTEISVSKTTKYLWGETNLRAVFFGLRRFVLIWVEGFQVGVFYCIDRCPVQWCRPWEVEIWHFFVRGGGLDYFWNALDIVLKHVEIVVSRMVYLTHVDPTQLSPGDHHQLPTFEFVAWAAKWVVSRKGTPDLISVVHNFHYVPNIPGVT